MWTCVSESTTITPASSPPHVPRASSPSTDPMPAELHPAIGIAIAPPTIIARRRPFVKGFNLITVRFTEKRPRRRLLRPTVR